MLPKPVPFSEARLRPLSPRREDPFESFLPSQPGFIRDFVMSLWNSEVPVAFSAWCAVWVLAMAVKREAWVRWFPDDPLFPNFYIILSGPPSSKKGKAISRAVKVYEAAIGPMSPLDRGEIGSGYRGRLSELWARDMKTHVPLVKDSSTTRPLKTAMSIRARKRAGSFEGLSKNLTDSEGAEIRLEDGSPWRYDKTSELGVVTEELSAFLGRQKYNEGLVPLMLAIYNTDASKEDRTDSKGVIRMRNLCTNWLAGTTPGSFQDAVAETAKGDGFFSRATIVHQDRKWQRFFPPPVWPHLPQVADLAERLAYVAETALGEHVLSPEADAAAKRWYDRHCEKIEARPELAHFWSRLDVQILKLALLMSKQRYADAGDRVITLADFEDAERLMRATQAFAPRIMDPNVAGGNVKIIRRVLKQIAGRGERGLPRRILLGNLKLPTSDIDLALSSLIGFGKIRAFSTEDGEVTEREYISSDVDEFYVVTEGGLKYGLGRIKRTEEGACLEGEGDEEERDEPQGDGRKARSLPLKGVAARRGRKRENAPGEETEKLA